MPVSPPAPRGFTALASRERVPWRGLSHSCPTIRRADNGLTFTRPFPLRQEGARLESPSARAPRRPVVFPGLGSPRSYCQKLSDSLRVGHKITDLDAEGVAVPDSGLSVIQVQYGERVTRKSVVLHDYARYGQ